MYLIKHSRDYYVVNPADNSSKIIYLFYNFTIGFVVSLFLVGTFCFLLFWH